MLLSLAQLASKEERLLETADETLGVFSVICYAVAVVLCTPLDLLVDKFLDWRGGCW